MICACSRKGIPLWRDFSVSHQNINLLLPDLHFHNCLVLAMLVMIALLAINFHRVTSFHSFLIRVHLSGLISQFCIKLSNNLLLSGRVKLLQSHFVHFRIASCRLLIIHSSNDFNHSICVWIALVKMTFVIRICRRKCRPGLAPADYNVEYIFNQRPGELTKSN